MTALIQSLLSSPPKHEPFVGPLLIYGAGNKGREIGQYLIASEQPLIGFIDANAQPEETCLDLPVHALDHWLSGHSVTDCGIIVAIHNPSVDLSPILARLKNSGFARVISPIDFYNQNPDALPDHFWLTASSFYQPFAENIARLFQLFTDDTSRHWLERLLAFRLGGDYSVLPLPDLENQYCPVDLPRWANPLHFIDCGAYTGDTLQQLVRHDYQFAAIAAFEPDPANFALLSLVADSLGSATCFPCGVAAENTMLRFAAAQGTASHLAADGGTLVQCLRIDDALHAFKPDLLKMDIEGGELEALLGARKTIESSRPGLAISLYHHPAHLWQIPELLASWEIGYRFYLRGHGHSGFETVLYAFPE